MNKVSKKSILYNKVSRVVINYNIVKIEYKIRSGVQVIRKRSILCMHNFPTKYSQLGKI